MLADPERSARTAGTTVFKSLGLGIEDVICAAYVLRELCAPCRLGRCRVGGGAAGAENLAPRPRASRAQPLYQADVAQLVEQLIRNQQVSGSIPLVGSIKAL